VIVTLLCVAAGSASAETLTVTNLNDSGAGSLREALIQAGSGATIVVPAGTITLTSGPLVIDKSLTIDGAGPSATALSGDMKSRVLEVAGAGVAATISSVQIIEGKPAPVENTTTHDFEALGGGVSVEKASLTLSHALVTDNEASTNGEKGGISEGGGVWASKESSLTLLDTLVSDDRALAEGSVHNGGISLGGGVAASGKLTIRGGAIEGNTSDASGAASGTLAESGGVDFIDSTETETATIEGATIAGNDAIANGLSAAAEGGAAQGGGMVLIRGSSVTLADDTVTENSAISDGGSNATGGLAGGGGIVLAESPATVVNLTVSANAARSNGFGTAHGGDAYGGGISTGEDVSVTNSTIVANTAEASGPGGAGNPHAGDVDDGGIRFENTIVADGVAGTGTENCNLADPGAASSAGGNIDSLDQCGFHAPGDHVNTNPMLGTLQPNGGPVQTIAPLPGSPAIDGGENSGCPSTDARGVLRPAGPACDVGAFELAQPSATTASATGVSTNAATLAGSARNPDLAGGEVEFQYGPTSAYGTTTAPQPIGATVAQAPFTAALTGLSPGTTYHFRIVVKNAIGTAFGADQTVTTASPAPISISTGPPPLPAPLTIVGALRPAASGTSLSLTLTCKGPAACPVTVIATTTEQLRHGRVVSISSSRPRTRTVVVASVSVTLAGGKVKVVTVRLNATGRRLEARFKRLPVTLTVYVTEQGHRKLVKRVRLVLAPRPRHKH
jgi:hypothetical protein